MRSERKKIIWGRVEYILFFQTNKAKHTHRNCRSFYNHPSKQTTRLSGSHNTHNARQISDPLPYALSACAASVRVRWNDRPRSLIGLYDNWAFQPISRFRGREELACFPASFVVVSCVVHHDAPTALRLLTAHLLRICCAPFLNSLPRLLFSYYCLAMAAARFCACPPAGISAAGVLPTCCPFVALLVYYAARL